MILLSAYGSNPSELSNRQGSAWRKLQLDLNAFADKLMHNVELAMEFWAHIGQGSVLNWVCTGHSPIAILSIKWIAIRNFGKIFNFTQNSAIRLFLPFVYPEYIAPYASTRKSLDIEKKSSSYQKVTHHHFSFGWWQANKIKRRTSSQV